MRSELREKREKSRAFIFLCAPTIEKFTKENKMNKIKWSKMKFIVHIEPRYLGSVMELSITY